MPNIRNCIGGFALTFAAVPATAQTDPVIVQGGIPTVNVSYADLDLTSVAGRQTMEGRVARAASGLCIEQRRKSLSEQMYERKCLSGALSKANIDIRHAVASRTVRLASKSSITLAVK